MRVTDAVCARRSVRAFLPKPVPEATIKEILNLACRAPSGGNLQPWRVYALAGKVLAEFKTNIATRYSEGQLEPPCYDVYPRNLWEPFRSRRREAGAQRYAAMGVTEKDPTGLKQLSERNYDFFGAPVGLLFCLDRRLGPPQWSDLGMYMQTVMLLAVERGLDTCAQESWSNWPDSVRELLALPPELMLFAGMSLGYCDTAHPLNSFSTSREKLEHIAELKGFETTLAC
jgi:nitroreductase